MPRLGFRRQVEEYFVDPFIVAFGGNFNRHELHELHESIVSEKKFVKSVEFVAAFIAAALESATFASKARRAHPAWRPCIRRAVG